MIFHILIPFVLSVASLPSPTHADDPPANTTSDIDSVVTLLNLVIDADANAAKRCLVVLAEKVQNREITDKQTRAARAGLEPTLAKILRAGPADPLHVDGAVLAASLRIPAGIAATRGLWEKSSNASSQRLSALAALVFLGDEKVWEHVTLSLAEGGVSSNELRAGILATLGRSDSPRVAEIVLAAYEKLDAELRPKAIELLTQRSAWSKSLLVAIGLQQIPASALNANQVAKLLASRDDELRKLVTEKWGSVRTERNPQREAVIAAVRKQLQTTRGNAEQGQEVFTRVCGQCHKIYGQGQEVGPDITANGRASFEQLLSNVLDPSLTIGASYQARTVITTDGRVLNGLLAEDNDQRIVLKIQGGKLETIPRDEVEELKVSQLSLMPEGLETQLKPEELINLFAFLTLDKPPADTTASLLPGTPRP